MACGDPALFLARVRSDSHLVRQIPGGKVYGYWRTQTETREHVRQLPQSGEVLMTKRRELMEPNSCFNRASEDELIFVLREHDVAAPGAIRDWVERRIFLRKNTPDDAQIQEALAIADTMELHPRKHNATT